MNTFIFFFLTATVISSTGIALILLVKKCFTRHITMRWHYIFGLLYFVLLAIPLIPRRLFSSINIGWLHSLNIEVAEITNTTSLSGGLYGIDFFQDYAVSVDRVSMDFLCMIFAGVWIAGIIISLAIALYCNRNLRLIKESVKPIKDIGLVSLFHQCKREVGVAKNILFGSSILIKTPMTMGFFKSLVILPATEMTLNDARYAMLHELTHCKKCDVQINGLMCLFQILYWFNPLVYIAFKQMRFDRELACDTSVLELLPHEHHINYGKALLSFVKTLSPPAALTLTANIGDSKPHIVKRVKHIASFKKDSTLLKAKSISMFLAMAFIIICQMPILSIFASNADNVYRFESDNVQYVDFSHFFEGFEGSFVLYDMEAGLYTIHNHDMSVTRVSPNSTYKIFSTLIALQEGVLDIGDTFREWDGTQHPFDAWNRSHDLSSAMNNSVNWYFQGFDAQVGMGRIEYHLAQLSYGNQNLSGNIMDFWLESSLRISPLEQVGLLTSLYRNETPFETMHENFVMDSLALTANDRVALSGKTGTGLLNGRITNGWFVGFVETTNGTFVFATFIRGEDNAGGSMAAQITLAILESKGLH